MNDDYLRGEPPDPDDPRLGDCLDEWQPNAAQRVAVAELLHSYVSRSPLFTARFLSFCLENYLTKAWPQATLALLEAFATTAIGASGEQLTIARLASDVVAALDDTLDEETS